MCLFDDRERGSMDILYTTYYICIYTYIHTDKTSGLPLFSLNIKLRIYRGMLRIGEDGRKIETGERDKGKERDGERR